GFGNTADAAGQAGFGATLAANTSPRFGTASGGSTTLDMGTANDMATAVVVQPDGKVILGGYTSGDFALARYQRDGTIDTTFGSAGKVTTDFGATDAGFDVLLQGDGKIVVVGTSNGNFAAARYHADGSLDTTFGTAGKTTVDVSGTDGGEGGALHADGKIVIGGWATVGGKTVFAAVRLTTTGALDTSFNGTGKVTTAVGSVNDNAWTTLVQADGKIVLAGRSVVGSYENTAVVRYNTDGSLDTGWGGTGIVAVSVSAQTDAANAIAQQADGKLVIVGHADSVGANAFDFSVLRFNTDGTLDASFSGDGMLTTDFGGGSNGDYGGGVAVQSDGKIVVSGDAYQSSYDFAL
ncbi:MAG: delta-60 repeat domain-containing protein, partial [Solirubrobacteraceae bacterium]|nr:delta-60 repeat domain-containing protein [Solirubrobacteraceae bacterium]